MAPPPLLLLRCSPKVVEGMGGVVLELFHNPGGTGQSLRNKEKTLTRLGHTCNAASELHARLISNSLVMA